MKADVQCTYKPSELETESFYSGLVQLLPGATAIIDGKGSVLHLNEQAKSCFDPELQNQIGSEAPPNLMDWFEEPAQFRSQLALAETAQGWTTVPVVLHRHSQPASLHIKSICLGNGAPIFIVHMAQQDFPQPNPLLVSNPQIPSDRQRDIDELEALRAQNQQLVAKVKRKEQSEAQLIAVLHAVGQGIVQVNSEGRIMMANRVFLDLFGYTREELYNQPIEMLLPRGQKDRYEELRQQYLQLPSSSAMRQGLELWGLHKNGTLIPVEIGINTVQQNGQFSVVASIIDNTERKRQQKEMLEKTRSLERSNEELKDFAYIATHDLKEPLRGISNYAMFLLEDYESLLDDEGKDMIHSIVRLSGRMEQFISELLNFSRVGQTELNISTVDLNSVASEAADTLAPRLSALKVDVRIDPLPAVPCDRMMVRQVFLNLISNAMKYNDKDKKWIQIGCDVHNGKRVLFVKDNGIGIAKPFYERIFKIFKRLHAQDRYEGGTGVGLSIVKKIIERHGGEVWLDSQEGEGTTFYFTLA